MAFQKRKPIHDWRSKLTDDELAQVKKIEKRIAASSRAHAAAVAELAPIRNRGTMRCIYEKNRANQPSGAAPSQHGE